ncbi:carbohydrate porin [Gluconobacter wancherniae]|uniref:Porin n=1 Tax=Gluconobacter wancherniae NBRC 103581 TaxID=656744 RepID=A0A511B2U4_9PROT|nr:carbohydrate porin [Gluconobacter wancherniae]MBF0854903.1 carbohydrate porin [Gluconobacter wancherniae]MBS1089434.1 carbohydrate porin [Gluconobacter wancherniae]MBS1095554.1 carbohydrate porin [Gluconobacter wancherniae]GBD57930.1 porin B [Gluconobacter wancherniae NBRC 103581]GEK94779.1 porin [Gluconobacter wancherniae NBRC 103581]
MHRLSFPAVLCAVSLLPAAAVAQTTAASSKATTSTPLKKAITVAPRMQVLPTVATSEWPDQNSVQASERVDTPLDQIHFDGSTVPPLPHPEALLTDPFGWNTALRRKGIALLMDNTNEFTGAITKPTPGYGLRQGSSNAGQYSFETDIDWEKLAGVRGFSTHTVMVGRYGIPASRMFGDNLNPSSEIYGAGGNVVVHLVYAYGEETLAHGHFDIVAGRIPFLNDFSSNPLYCTFMNNAFCGNPKAAGENTAHSSYPDGVWATRVRVRPTTHTYIQAGVYFSQAGIYGNTQYRTGFKFNGADINGESIPVEAGWEPVFGADKLPGHYKVGYAVDTIDHNDTYYDSNGNAFALSGLPARKLHGSWAAWFLADQMVWRHHNAANKEAGLTLVAGFYANSPRNSTRAQQYQMGFVDSGLLRARPFDTIGINFMYVKVANNVTSTQILQMEQGQPLLNGSYGPQSFGEVLEATYRIRVMRGVTFAPDFQYFIRPGAQAALRNAAMLGFRSHIQFF